MYIKGILIMYHGNNDWVGGCKDVMQIFRTKHEYYALLVKNLKVHMHINSNGTCEMKWKKCTSHRIMIHNDTYT